MNCFYCAYASIGEFIFVFSLSAGLTSSDWSRLLDTVTQTVAMDQAHAKTYQEVLDYFGTDPDKGLTPDQVKKYQEKYGPNGEDFSFFFPPLFGIK